MDKIYKGFKNGLTLEQIKLFANPNYTTELMKEIQYAFDDGWTIEQINIVLNNFDGDTITRKQIFKWFNVLHFRKFTQDEAHKLVDIFYA